MRSPREVVEEEQAAKDEQAWRVAQLAAVILGGFASAGATVTRSDIMEAGVKIAVDAARRILKAAKG